MYTSNNKCDIILYCRSLRGCRFIDLTIGNTHAATEAFSMALNYQTHIYLYILYRDISMEWGLQKQNTTQNRRTGAPSNCSSTYSHIRTQNGANPAQHTTHPPHTHSINSITNTRRTHTHLTTIYRIIDK